MIRQKLLIKGKVQGVGFRPFVYKLAKQFNLKGFVRNNQDGVEVQIEGQKEHIANFKQKLTSTLPSLANISGIKYCHINVLNDSEFNILHSECLDTTAKTASIPTDSAICDKCKTDISSEGKYHNYFGTSCTNCGVRYSVIKTIPYDRANTSFDEFVLCSSCQKDYDSPLHRRYHAQSTVCKECGPQINIEIKNKKIKHTQNNIYKNISSLINDGFIGAIKGVGGFHLVCDSTNDEVIQKLREFKNRPSKPFALMCKDLEQIKQIANINKKEKELLVSKESPIVVLNKKSNSIIGDLVAPNITKIGCMLPYGAIHYIFFKLLSKPIIATSANLGGEPIITTKKDILKKLPFVDFVVDFNREIVNAIDDSVVQVVNNDILTMRLSRGYAPKEITLPFKLDKKILALGAMQKVTVALAFDNKLILSPYIGDLDSISSMEFFKKTINTFKRFYDFEPDIIICDKHPNYESTKWAKN